MDRAIAIEVSHLSKSYDGHRAVADISFTVYAGEIFGLLGPNGAGKSTTLRTLITLLTPSSGRATLFGLDSVRDADSVRQMIGYVPQERAIDRFLTGREHLELLAALYHLPKSEANKRIAELLTLVELDRGYECKLIFFAGGALAMTVHAPREGSNELRGTAKDPRGWDTEFDADLRGSRVVGTYRQPHDRGTFVLDEV